MVKKPSPISNYFLTQVPPAINSDVGETLARGMVADAKYCLPELREPTQLMPYLLAWNTRWGSPFSPGELRAFCDEPLRKPKPRPKKVDPETFATRLLDE